MCALIRLLVNYDDAFFELNCSLTELSCMAEHFSLYVTILSKYVLINSIQHIDLGILNV